MKFYKIFNKFYNNKNIIKFIYNINRIDRGNKNINGNNGKLSSLISFNFLKNKISTFKIYCEVFRTFSPNEILTFLPTYIDFLYYFDFWDNNLHSSLCFGIKLDRKLNPIYYFHIKFGRNSNSLDEFKVLSIFNEINYNYHNLGISYEYKSINKFVKKFYVYFFKKNEIIFLLKKFNISEDPYNIDHIEYTELSNGENKIIVVYKLNNFKTPVYVKNQLYKKFSILERVIDFFLDEFGILPTYFGKYKNTTTSVYWSLTDNILNKPYVLYHIKN